MELSSGAYSLMLMAKDAIFAVRDPHGFRPLCLGKIPAEEGEQHPTYCVASESCALGTIGKCPPCFNHISYLSFKVLNSLGRFDLARLSGLIRKAFIRSLGCLLKG